MVEANHSLSKILTQPQLRITTASVVLAQLRARNAVKAELRKQGLKVSHYAAREISSWAQVYLDDHPILIAEASGRGLDCARSVRQTRTEGVHKTLGIEQSQGERSVANGQS